MKNSKAVFSASKMSVLAGCLLCFLDSLTRSSKISATEKRIMPSYFEVVHKATYFSKGICSRTTIRARCRLAEIFLQITFMADQSRCRILASASRWEHRFVQ